MQLHMVDADIVVSTISMKKYSLRSYRALYFVLFRLLTPSDFR